MNYAILKAELDADPLVLGYAALAPHSPGVVVALLNAPNYTMVRSRYITARTALAELGVTGAVIMEKLVGFASQGSFAEESVEGLRIATKWAMKFVDAAGEGLDIGHPTSQTLIDALAAAGVITAAEAAALKGLAIQPASRAEVLMGAGTLVTEADLRAALYS